LRYSTAFLKKFGTENKFADPEVFWYILMLPSGKVAMYAVDARIALDV
jgi:hypothetical protein